MRPRALLDVDGVVVVYGDHDWEVVDFGKPTMTVPRGMTARVHALTDAFDLVWATRWHEAANFRLAPALGLSAHPFVRFPDLRLDKSPAISDYLAATAAKTVAWIDDDVREDQLAWAEARTARGLPTLAVKTDPMIGLTDAHVERLLDWATALAHTSSGAGEI